MGVSLKKIAEAAGVSEATASLSLNNRPGVNADTRKKVCKIAEELGYIPSVNAQNLVKKKSGLVGIIVPNLSNLVYSTIVRSVENQLRNRGYKMIMATSESNVSYEQEMIKHFIAFRVEGVLIYPIIKENPNPEYLNLLSMNDIPLMFIGSYYRGINAPHVMSDIYGAIRHATKYLYDRGGRSFYYFGGCRNIVSNVLKLKAIKDTLLDKGIIFPEERYIELEKSNYQCAYQTTKMLFSQTRDVDAILAADAYTSLAVYNALTENGFRVPEDVSLISFDNLIPPEACKVRLTCIEQNIDEMAKNTLDELFEKISGSDINKNIMLDTKLIVRDTTK